MPFLDSHQLTFHDCNEDSDIEGNLMVFKVTVGDDGPGDDVFIKFTNHKFHTFSCSTDIKYSSVSTLLTQHLKPLP